MRKRVDVAIAFYGKPMQTIVAIKSLLQYSRQHIDKIYLTQERMQPHNDWGGVHKVVDYFRDEPITFVVYQPYYFLSTNVWDVEKTRRNRWYRWSIMYQYALEKTDKPYLCIIHNDMLYHADMIGPMLAAFDEAPTLAGTGAIGQCWACPGSLSGRCSPATLPTYRPTKEEALELHRSYALPRQQKDIDIIEAGRVFPFPECRLNEHTCLINVDLYSKVTIPSGDIGCLGGTWGGADLGMIWFYELVNRGYKFKHFVLEEYGRHAPFDDSGSGSMAYSKADRYWNAERLAAEYINANYPKKAEFGLYVRTNTTWDAAKRRSWLTAIQTYRTMRKIAGKV